MSSVWAGVAVPGVWAVKPVRGARFSTVADPTGWYEGGMRWIAVALALLVGMTGCNSDVAKDPSGPTSSFTTPSDGAVRIPQGTVEYMPGGVQVGVGGVLRDPERAMLSVMKSGAESVQLTLGVGEKGAAFGQTVTVSAVEFGDHDYAWVKVLPS
jgi:hypothetical protein